MVTRKTSRRGVVNDALQLFRRKGYHATSMADIGTACGLLKGSIYHYFSTKEELALAAIEEETAAAREGFFSVAYQEKRAAGERLRDFASGMVVHFMGREGGCLMANLAAESSDVLPDLMPSVSSYFEEWVEALAHILEDRYGRHRALELAADSLARTQGALLLMKVDPRAQSALQRARYDLISLLD
ncbi:MAG: TetR/AcrR family transcriptional regulator [Rhodospirillales bacterium]|nr:TetR/AcrR family transcriptional regulator [Rhodospirillales bacterium]